MLICGLGIGLILGSGCLVTWLLVCWLEVSLELCVWICSLLEKTKGSEQVQTFY